MSMRKSNPHRWKIVVTALAAGILLPLFAFTAHAQAADGKAHAQAVAPVSIEQDAGASNDGGGDDNGGDHNGKDGSEVRGLVEQLPEGGLIGAWVVSGKPYTVTADTEINQKYGTVEVGACVKLELKSDKSTVREAKTAPEYVCDKGDDNGGGDAGQGHGELYARLVSFPPNLVGQWVIGTLTFTATEKTEFKQENGQFTVGEFVKVEFSVQADGSFLAREIKTAIKPGPGHGDDDDDDHPHHGGKAFGKIEVLPDGGTTGIWQIAGVTYTVNVSTELKNRGEAFAVGQNVKVEYKLDADGNRLAREIKRMPPKAGGPQDGVFKLVGTVQALPSDGFIGDWTIAGVAVVADANTKFEEEHGMLQVDAFVEATYVMSGSTRLLKKVETEVLPGAGDDDHVGRVEKMDDSMSAASGDAASNTWQVGGRTFVVNDATAIDGNLAQSSLAVVNSYKAADGTQVATRIEAVNVTSLLYLPNLSKR